MNRVAAVDSLAAVVEAGRSAMAPARSADLVHGVPVYDVVPSSDDRASFAAEWVDVLMRGAGIVVLREAFVDHEVIDRVTATFFDIIDEQRVTGRTAGDHFAAPGTNDRVWNALQKLAERDPKAFVDYYSNPVLAWISEAWLGPGYQMTSQVNVVNPGGAAQSPHCDFHLGFMTDEQAAMYPAHAHALSPALTLQGAVAHCDMPVETGPTLYLPHSQKYSAVYRAWRDPEVVRYFDEHHVQLPLRKGDAVFFNPSVLHAAGTNRTTDARRVANLLQVSSAFGRTMESIDRVAMCSAVYPALAELADPEARDRALAACAEGYAFPTNLDLDQPIDGLAPLAQAEIVRRALGEGWDDTRLRAELSEHASRRRP
jgi:ectoine hydroxylase-related dioxygenase (phytanoyl-CoA dioxygenase family)